jgi:hypothetical protein
MTRIEQRLQELGLILPQPLQLPPEIVLPFPWVRIIGTRALISGHGPTNQDGSLAQPLGKVGQEVSQEQAYLAARLTGLAILGSLQRELESLDRILAWTRIFRDGQLCAGVQEPARCYQWLHQPHYRGLRP